MKEDVHEEGGVLEIEGQDSDKSWCPPVSIQILVNKRKVFEGPNGFVKCGWSRRTWPLSSPKLAENAPAGHAHVRAPIGVHVR